MTSIGGLSVPSTMDYFLDYMKQQGQGAVQALVQDAINHPTENLKRIQESTPTTSEVRQKMDIQV